MSTALKTLAAFTPEEHPQFYKVFRLQVFAHPDGPLKVRGAFGEDLDVCEQEIAYPRLCSHSVRVDRNL